MLPTYLTAEGTESDNKESVKLSQQSEKPVIFGEMQKLTDMKQHETRNLWDKGIVAKGF